MVINLNYSVPSFMQSLTQQIINIKDIYNPNHNFSRICFLIGELGLSYLLVLYQSVYLLLSSLLDIFKVLFYKKIKIVNLNIMIHNFLYKAAI